MKRDHVFQPGTPEALFEKAAVSLLPYSDYTVASNDIRVCLKAVTDDTPKLHIATVELAILGVEYSRRVEAGSGIVSLLTDGTRRILRYSEGNDVSPKVVAKMARRLLKRAQGFPNESLNVWQILADFDR